MTSDQVIPKTRSPNYPKIGLPRAIELARVTYDSALMTPIDTRTALQLMGYKADSGPARSALSAVKKYGLIEGRDQALKITDLALRILQPMNEEERVTAILDAAFRPILFLEIKNQFGGKLPSDNVLTAYLVRNHGFNPSGAKIFVKTFQDTVKLVESLTGVESATDNVDGGGEYELHALNNTHQTLQDEVARNDDVSEGSVMPVDTHSFGGGGRLETLGGGERLTFRLSKEARVHVIFEGEVTQRALDRLISFLELAKDSYAES